MATHPPSIASHLLPPASGPQAQDPDLPDAPLFTAHELLQSRLPTSGIRLPSGMKTTIRLTRTAAQAVGIVVHSAWLVHNTVFALASPNTVIALPSIIFITFSLQRMVWLISHE